eukprot:tig00000342_g24236.t1
MATLEGPNPPSNVLPTRQHSVRRQTRTIKLDEWPELAAEGLTGSIVWEASEALSSLIENKSLFKEGHWKDKRVVEVGAGLGLVGITCALLGAQVTLTDQKKQLPLLQQNVQSNLPPDTNARCVELTWGQAADGLEPPFDYVLASDLVYERASFVPLVQTFCDLSGPDTVILLAYRWRTLQTEEGEIIPPELFIRFLEESFDVSHLSNDLVARTALCSSVHLFRLRKKQ